MRILADNESLGCSQNPSNTLHTDCSPYFLMHLSMSSPRGGGGGSGNPREFDCDAYTQGEDFDLTSCI